jgi:hypothetical protein
MNRGHFSRATIVQHHERIRDLLVRSGIATQVEPDADFPLAIGQAVERFSRSASFGRPAGVTCIGANYLPRRRRLPPRSKRFNHTHHREVVMPLRAERALQHLPFSPGAKRRTNDASSMNTIDLTEAFKNDRQRIVRSRENLSPEHSMDVTTLT